MIRACLVNKLCISYEWRTCVGHGTRVRSCYITCTAIGRGNTRGVCTWVGDTAVLFKHGNARYRVTVPMSHRIAIRHARMMYSHVYTLYSVVRCIVVCCFGAYPIIANFARYTAGYVHAHDARRSYAQSYCIVNAMYVLDSLYIIAPVLAL